MNRAGEYVLNLKGKAEYKSFKPAPLPDYSSINVDREMICKLIDANKYISRLNTLSELVGDIDLIIYMYLRKESLISSQIEGTQCTLDDVLDPSIDTNKNLEVSDVINYVKACTYGIDRLDKIPICNRLLKEIHKILLANVRGKDKNPGEFRNSQNWIGPANSTLAEARYIPPNVTDMNDALNRNEKYINNDDDTDPLVKIALIYYQFETIHPFLDGNGRVGRLMILLYLLQNGIVSQPIIYISYYLKKNQFEYYDRMNEVRRTGNYEQWIKFFLDAVAQAAKDSSTTIQELNALHNMSKVKILDYATRNDNIIKLFNYIERHPIIDIKTTANELGISYNTVASYIENMIKVGILKEKTNKSRNRVYVYEEYLNILRKDT